MTNSDTRRISRLTAILTLLQSKRILTSTALAEKFGVSIRTIYRDVKVLEQAGVPIYTEEGKGYTLLDGYRIPPVMFTEDEANALITIEQVVKRNSDSSLVKAYGDAVTKIKAVLLYATKHKIELLADRIAISPATPNATTSNSLTVIQTALTSFKVLDITYRSTSKDEITNRNIEPFALYYTLQENWSLIAFCRLRKEYRMFNLDRITRIAQLNSSFEPHDLTLASYLKDKEKNFQHP
jgi:predicted DNA-binding transcriptional regulator YafY